MIAAIKRLPEWYEEFVPDDAKTEITRKFLYTPEVAPLMSDGYSSGSDGYMTASINTAMSYASVVSNLTTESQSDSHNKRNPAKATFPQSQSKKAWNTPPPTMIQAPDTEAAGIVSELNSSKSEVEALKAKMSEMEADKNAQIQEIEQKAEQQRLESEARAQEQRTLMEQQVEAQRNEFTQRLEEQRKALEKENLLRQQELEARFQEQIHQAIQAHLPTPSTAPPPPRHTPEEVAQRMENQDVRIQQLTDMIHQLLTRSPAEPAAQPARSSTGKRHAPHAVVDLTMDHYDLENASQQTEIRREDQGAKKRDTKETPRQNLTGNISIKIESSGSPAPSELSMSMMDPPVIQNTESDLWEAGLHPPLRSLLPSRSTKTCHNGTRSHLTDE